MDEEHKIQPPGLPSGQEASDKSDEWLCFKNQYEDLTSKVHLKKQFYEKTKLTAKKIRSNKKNPTKASNSQFSADSPMLPKISEDSIYQTAIPNTITYSYEGLGSRIYNCNFTNDGKYILVTSQTGTAFFKFSEDNQIGLTKVITCSNVSWAITDSNISSDNKFMIHSTLSPNVHLFDLEKSKYVNQFNLKTGAQSSPDNEDEDDNYYSWFSTLRVFSLKLSGDNKEVIAGCGRMQNGAPIQVFDLVKNKLKHSIIAHKDDINSICYVDRANSSIFISGSDDGLCKLWDTRILKNNEPVGIFYGHFAGLTCVNSKEDNRYFISNSKDQSIKLWDLRKSTTEQKEFLFMRFDYRYQRPGPSQLEELRKKREAKKLPDQSVMTFQGHSVCGTLIRCHFSPLSGTGQRYVYSGSYDGKVYIYDTVNGENIACLDLPKSGNAQGPIVRDCAWHPYSQNLVTTSFSGDFHRWEYMDLRDSEKIQEEGEWETDEEETNGVHNHMYQTVVDDDEDEDDDDYDGEEDENEDYEDDEEFVPVDKEIDEEKN